MFLFLGTITTLDEKIAHYNDESNRKLEGKMN